MSEILANPVPPKAPPASSAEVDVSSELRERVSRILSEGPSALNMWLAPNDLPRVERPQPSWNNVWDEHLDNLPRVEGVAQHRGVLANKLLLLTGGASHSETSQSFAEAGIAERVVLQPVRIPAFTNKVVPAGRFSRKSETIREEHGQRQPAFNELVPTSDSSEPAYSVTYVTPKDSRPGHKYAYRSDASGSVFGIALPQSRAEELFALVRAEPKAIRYMVERAAIDRFGIGHDAWLGDGVHFPYDKWRVADNGIARMAFATDPTTLPDAAKVVEF